MKKIGILTSGGDCQGLNSAMSAFVRALCHEDNSYELIGIKDGYKGLIDGICYKMKEEDFYDISSLGGTILGTSRQSFKEIKSKDSNKLEKMIKNYKEMALDCLVVLGGNGTHKTANFLSENGLNIVTMPKTIDNDIYATELTFGFMSAVSRACEYLESIKTTACSHHRVFVVELMGHDAGWLALEAGIAANCDMIIIPEIHYKLDKVLEAIEKNRSRGKDYAIICVAEGAVPCDCSNLKHSQFKEELKKQGFSSAAYKLSYDISKAIKQEVRTCIPAHFQRGGRPVASDIILSSCFGSFAAKYVKEQRFAVMTALNSGKIEPVPLSQTSGLIKKVPLNGCAVAFACSMGISFGV